MHRVSKVIKTLHAYIRPQSTLSYANPNKSRLEKAPNGRKNFYFFLVTLSTSSIARPGGKLCFSFSAFSGSSIESVYRYREHLTLNFVCVLPPATFDAIFFIRAWDASFLCVILMNCLISRISLGIVEDLREVCCRSLRTLW